MSLDRTFLRLGALWLVIGMSFGLVMGVAEDFKYAPVHAHINLVGFACHLLFGYAYRQWPQLSGSALAAAQFWIFVLSTPIMVIGLYFTIGGGPALPTIVGSLGVLAGAVLFATMVWRMPANAAAAEARP